MRRSRIIQACFLVLSVTLMMTFGQGRTRTYATTSPSIAPDTTSDYVIPGEFFNSCAALTEGIPALTSGQSIYNQSIHITNGSAGCLQTGWTVQVDSELMLITGLTPGISGNPDTMVVNRAQNGTVAARHTSTTVVQSKALNIDIWAQNVSVPTYGFGAFNVQITIPSAIQIVQLVYNTTWQSSTGRISSCDPVIQQSPGVWQFDCASLNNPGYGQPSWYPPGPNGSGIIAHLTILPPSSLGLYKIQLTGSYITDLAGNNLSATVSSPFVKVVACPDTNLDGLVDSGDMLNIAKNFGDSGKDSGATLLNITNATKTQIAVSDQSRLSKVAPNNVISVDGEVMTVGNLVDGSPDTMTVTRGTYYPSLAATHKAGAHIWLNQNNPNGPGDGNFDGEYGYSPARDLTHDGILDSADELLLAEVGLLTGVCPASP